ncbi:histidinol dehydrogenase [Natranaerofaba carboxydovora]|uniref:histidinol dehydrogenase n=1 Tax=Natranaerofaba carboxydovora TaxID=2742683 RepID=UPI001F146FC8|nr:histidinol dehydrogenase [Natranaerofaba carboxydovora]UMZ73590.1 Histidinol dehydrogenase [Natranaerofaba carboxydovora]
MTKKVEIKNSVAEIIEKVKTKKDNGLVELIEKYDGIKLKPENLRLSKEDITKAYEEVDDETINKIKFAASQISFFSKNQLECLKPLHCQNIEGVELGHKIIPIESCGCYVPAGRYPLPSSALMSIIPARTAGVKRIAACAPPSKTHGTIHPIVVVAMDIAGADEIFMMGGAQAIATYAYGTSSIPPVDMIVGPGNTFVTEAKRQVSGDVGIDMLAGPSEVLIIADELADPNLVAIDLLAKCEHDPDSVAILVTTSQELIDNVKNEFAKELESLETKEVIKESWEKYGVVKLVDDLDEAAEYSNKIAPEHLQVITENDDELIEKLTNYGSLFIGPNSPVAFGDYVSGTNHILPTGTGARFTNGLWVGKFLKVLSYQKITERGAKKLANACMHLAEMEGLYAHKKSAEYRINNKT